MFRVLGRYLQFAYLDSEGVLLAAPCTCSTNSRAAIYFGTALGFGFALGHQALRYASNSPARTEHFGDISPSYKGCRVLAMLAGPYMEEPYDHTMILGLKVIQKPRSSWSGAMTF